MKLTHTKKAGRRWTLVFETEEEAKEFHHYVGCRDSTRHFDDGCFLYHSVKLLHKKLHMEVIKLPA